MNNLRIVKVIGDNLRIVKVIGVTLGCSSHWTRCVHSDFWFPRVGRAASVSAMQAGLERALEVCVCVCVCVYNY
jgi:hypothetical protein